MSEIHRWYVIWRYKESVVEHAAWGSEGPFSTHAEAVLKMQEMAELIRVADDRQEVTIADVVFPSEIRG